MTITGTGEKLVRSACCWAPRVYDALASHRRYLLSARLGLVHSAPSTGSPPTW